ncbi:MAG TPA: PH domain-containing protein [Candidatus Onthocola stercoravium]|nr:PH domain-containing protein [Candidatus Onthocola stercoravium]
MSITYQMARNFKRKYPLTVAWRIKQHCKIIDKHINPDEKVLYVFLGQKNASSLDFVNTYVFALTNKRLIYATKRLVFGYFFYAITPDMFNDLTVKQGLIWGKIIIDSVKEEVLLSNISKNALDEIETKITQYMMEEKKKYHPHDHRH